MREEADIVVAGAGATALSAALALGAAGFEVVLAGRPEPAVAAAAGSRTVALLEGSLRFYRALGAWEQFAAQAAPLAKLRIVDDTGSLFRVPPVEFEAREIGLAAFGENIETAQLVEGLAERLQGLSRIRRIDAAPSRFDLHPSHVAVHFADGRSVAAPLLVAADGARSAARGAAGIAVRSWRYPQVALTAILSHALPHRAVSTEFHSRTGPFTLVPLPAGKAPHRSSLVWMMAPQAADRREALDAESFALEAERTAHSLLGRMRLERGIGSFPMLGLRALRLTAPRVALVGEAAHVLPPIGAQGLNLGLRDIAHLVDCLFEQRRDIGAAAALARYESRRAADIEGRLRGVDMLNRSLLMDGIPADLLRGLGLVALSARTPLRRAVMRESIMPRHSPPRLMRGTA